MVSVVMSVEFILDKILGVKKYMAAKSEKAGPKESLSKTFATGILKMSSLCDFFRATGQHPTQSKFKATEGSRETQTHSKACRFQQSIEAPLHYRGPAT